MENKKDSRLLCRIKDNIEFQRALLLKKIDNDLETVFIMTNAKYSFVSSSGVRELATFGGQLKDLVPECIEERVRKHVYKKFE